MINMCGKNEGIELKCPKCEYEWTYKGNLIKATCPSCGSKVDKRVNEVKKK
ncbi:MAG: hypothetical protein ACLFUH_07150 [Bacteroidales bacterium]